LITTALFGQGTSTPGPFVLPANTGFVPTEVTSISDAWFIQPEIHLTDRLDVVLGARITKDKKSGFEVAPDQYVASGGNVSLTPVNRPVRYRDTQKTFLAGLNYRPTDDILTYIKYADGYISGGQLATIPFEPEHAYSYEAGVKADLFDGKLRSNLSVFHVDYKGIQYTTSGTLTGVASSFLYGQALVSVGDAKANGFEWENTIAPIRGVTLTANVGYTDFKFDQNTIYGGPLPGGGICRGPSCAGGFVLTTGSAGFQEFTRPKWTGSVSAQYDTEEVVAGGHFTIRADGNFRSKSLLTYDLSLGNALGEAPSEALRDSATVPFNWIVNARVGLVGMELGGTKVDFSIWGKNLFDNDNMTQYVNLGPVSSVIYERARTYGVDLSLSF
jgi:iron complex outermembrane receptor protein